MKVKFFSDDDTAVGSDSAANLASKLTAFLYELRRLYGRYGSTVYGTAAVAASSAFDADANNGTIDSQTLISPTVAWAYTPTLTTVSPSSGTHATGVAITLTGTNFQSGCGVKINNVACTSVVRVSSTSITCTTPNSLSAGTYDVKVTNASGANVTKTGGYTAT